VREGECLDLRSLKRKKEDLKIERSEEWEEDEDNSQA
jgi:hypothetical protein